MAKKIIIKTADGADQYLWTVLSESVALELQRGSLADLKQWMGTESCQLIFLAPAADILVREIPFTDTERKHILKTVPYLLEESLIGDVDELHIVAARPGQGSVTVAAVDEEKMRAWMQHFEDAGLTLNQCLPEQMVLTPDQNWSLLYYNSQYLFRDGNGRLYAIDESAIDLTLQIATEQFSALPTSIELIVTESRSQEKALKALPDPLHHLVRLSVKPFPALAAEGFAKAAGWNLLQGKFARAAQWGALWLQWRAVIIVLALGLGVHIAVGIGEYQVLNKANTALQQQIEEVHRSVFPRGQIVDPRKQMENELARLKGGGSGEGFVAKLSRIGSAVQGAEGLSINSLSFDEKNGDFRLDLLVKNFQEIEKIKSGIEKQGLEAELLNSNAQGQELRARLRISG